MNNPTLKFAAVLILGILLGLAGGAWGFRYFLNHGGAKDPTGLFLRKLDRELKLSADQKPKVAEILDARKVEMDKLQDETRPKFEAIRKDGLAQIRVLLTVDQAAKFDAMVAKWEKRRAEKGLPPGPPPDGRR